jgi:hypothetical protein
MKMDQVSFAVSKADRAVINKIVARGWKIDWLRASYPDRQSMNMDVTAVHANGNPLRLADLLAADDFNFAHDMSGICNCLDRRTGQLTRNFRPRFSVPSSLVEA